MTWFPRAALPDRDSIVLLLWPRILGTDYGLGAGLSSAGLNAGAATIAPSRA